MNTLVMVWEHNSREEDMVLETAETLHLIHKSMKPTKERKWANWEYNVVWTFDISKFLVAHFLQEDHTS